MHKLLILPALLLLLLSLAGCFTTHGGPYYRDDRERYEECRRENPDNPERCRDRYPRDGRHMRGY